MGTQKWFTHEVVVSKVKPSLHPRAIKEAALSGLAASMERALMEPIVVTDDLLLIAGQRRLLAAKMLGWKTIPARVLDVDNGEAELMTIDENLEREELTDLERVQAIARRKVLYEAINPGAKSVRERGGPGRGNKTSDKMAVVSFAADTAAKTGQSERSIQRDVAIGNAIDGEAADEIADTPTANSKTELAQLAKLPPTEQRQVARKIATGTAKKVKDAVAGGTEKEPDTIEGRMKAANTILESLARRCNDIIKDISANDNPHLVNDRFGRASTAIAQLKSAAATIRAAKGAGVCPYCNGHLQRPNGKDCEACCGTGWVGKVSLESAPEK